MRLKLPFLNRERYILIKAYAFDRVVHKDKTLSMTGSAVGVLNRCPVPSPLGHVDFSTCYGMSAAMNRSLTLSSWSELKVDYVQGADAPTYIAPIDNEMFRIADVRDSIYKIPPNAKMHKIIAPWMLTCNKDVNFVMSKHLMNTLPMQIATGVLHFEITHGPHIFNAVYEGQSYKIPYREPLVQLFPLSDLPLHLETYWDSKMFVDLFDSRKNRPFFRATALKRIRQIKGDSNA